MVVKVLITWWFNIWLAALCEDLLIPGQIYRKNCLGEIKLATGQEWLLIVLTVHCESVIHHKKKRRETLSEIKPNQWTNFITVDINYSCIDGYRLSVTSISHWPLHWHSLQRYGSSSGWRPRTKCSPLHTSRPKWPPSAPVISRIVKFISIN